MKIVSIVGARPQFIKEAVVQREIRKYSDMQEIIVHTGQHYDKNMSELFFGELEMPHPKYVLEGRASRSHGEMTGQMMIDLEKIIQEENPDLVILYGDTNSTLAGGIVASKLKVKTAHIEAGIRSFPKDIPEEMNRMMVDCISNYLFCPSDLALRNLERENNYGKLYMTGDVMYDIFFHLRDRFNREIRKTLGLEKGNYVLMTMHRDFNVDRKEILEEILLEINKISKEVPVVYPVHPRTAKKIKEFGLKKLISDINTIPPIGYLDLMGLVQDCWKVITDSGGLQKEAYFSGKMACVLLEDTGWSELIDKKINYLVNVKNLREILFSKEVTVFEPGIYGDGKAAEKIVDILRTEFL